jgi:hypothetical protein
VHHRQHHHRRQHPQTNVNNKRFLSSNFSQVNYAVLLLFCDSNETKDHQKKQIFF